MGEIADSILDGEFDCITGEYLGEGVGYPRSIHDKGKHSVTNNPVHGIKKYLQAKGYYKKEIRSIVALFSNNFLELDYKQVGFEKCCHEIQKCFGEFIKFVTDYKKGAFN